VLLLFSSEITLPQSRSEPKTVDSVDLERYAGLWYEIARIPNSFQDDCVKGVTAEYKLRDDGLIDVTNRCLEQNGTQDEAVGLARIEDKKTNARLKVSFFSIFGWRPFWGDYWIIDLAEDYSFAVVCSPDREYGWVLARRPELPDHVRDGIFKRLVQQGFDRNDFKLTNQEPHS
jgi:apolipoprotein D and lipocalin family protein